MVKKLWYSAILAGVSLFLIVSGPVLADDGPRGHRHGRGHHKHYQQHRYVHHYPAPRYMYHYPAPRYVPRYHRHYRPVVQPQIVLPVPLLPRLIFHALHGH